MYTGPISIEQFLAACEAWNLEEVHQIVESGFDVDTFDDDHVTGLQMAAATGNIGIVQYLLDRDADIEKSNQVGMTALHHAAKNGHANIVRILVQRGANYQKLTYLGASAMTLAAGNGHTEVVKLLLDLRVNINPSHTALCPTPVIAAAFRRHTHLCALLSHRYGSETWSLTKAEAQKLAVTERAMERRMLGVSLRDHIENKSLRGAYLDGNIQRLSNLSALSTAISCGATTVVGALLELGANPSFRSLNGMTAMELAQHLQRDEILAVMNSAIRSTQKEEEPIEVDLRQLIYNGDEHAIRTVLSRHLSYVPLPEDTTPLMYAVLLAGINIVKAIRESSDVDINAAENVSGLTALMLATIIGDHEIVEYLVNAGADVSLMSADGFTAIDYAFAASNINADMLCLLQLRLENSATTVVQRPGSHQQQHPSHRAVIHTGRAKIFNKLSSHVGLGAYAKDSLDRREKPNFSRAHLAKLLQIHQHDNKEFILANEILKSIGNEKTDENGDDLHRCIKVVRYVAEICASQGMLNLPVVFTLENRDFEKRNSAKYAPSLNGSESMRTSITHRHRDFLSVAQKNAYLYYEYRFTGRNSEGTYLSVKRHLYDDSDSRKISSSTSTSDRSLSTRSQHYSSLDRSSTHTLGTTPRFRSRSRETIKRYCGTGADEEDNDDRSSPSRSSLNQYTFAIKDEEHMKKSSSTLSLDGLVGRHSSFTGISRMSAVERKLSNMSATKSVTYDIAYQQRRQKVTEDLIWEKLRAAGLGKYIGLLRDEEVDKGTFLTLTNDDLIDIGVTDATHRIALLRIAKSLR